MFYCIYISVARVPPRSIEEASIYLEARSTNARLDITGYLHREDGYFAQYIEGPEHSLKALLHMIERDRRHAEMRILVQAHCEGRRFAGWDMAFTDEERRSFSLFQQARGRPESLALCPPAEILSFMQERTVGGTEYVFEQFAEAG